MGYRKEENLPGEPARCDGSGVVEALGRDGLTHMCLTCGGAGCAPKKRNRAYTAARRERLAEWNDSIVMSDQKGRMCLVDTTHGQVFVVEDE